MSFPLQGNAVRVLTSSNDWTLGNSNAGFLQLNAAIVQQLNCRLLQILGECFWDTQAGINWFAFLSSNQPHALTLAIQTVILNTPVGIQLITGINSTSFTLNPSTRVFSVNWDVSTVYSQSIQGSASMSIPGS